jgi:hypothetical protein
MTQRLRRLRRFLRPLLRPDRLPPGWEATRGRGLFVIGHARTGTTALQNALNAHPDIFLLGEPDFHLRRFPRDFARRYNAWHRSNRNQETKSTYCPPFFHRGARWDAYVLRLLEHYRYVGAKLVLDPGDELSHDLLQEFLARRFYDATFVFTFRDPGAVADSLGQLAELFRFPPRSMAEVLAAYLSVMLLYMRMARTFPAVFALFHEDASAASLAGLGTQLGLDLSCAAPYYRAERVTPRPATGHARADAAALATARGLHTRLREQVGAGLALPQLEQNDAHVLPAHFTALGALFRDTEAAMRSELDRIGAGG